MKDGALNEHDITEQIRSLLWHFNVWHFKHWSGKYSMHGISDILGCKDGRMFGIEVKCKGNKPTQDQLKFLRDLEHAGGIGIVAYSPEDVVKGLGLNKAPLFGDKVKACKRRKPC